MRAASYTSLLLRLIVGLVIESAVCTVTNEMGDEGVENKTCVKEYCSYLTSKAEHWACVTEHCRSGLQPDTQTSGESQERKRRWIDSTHTNRGWLDGNPLGAQGWVEQNKEKKWIDPLHEQNRADFLPTKKWIDFLHETRNDNVPKWLRTVDKKWIDSTHMHYAEGRRSVYDSLEVCIRKACQGLGGPRLRRCALACSEPRAKKRSTEGLVEVDDSDEQGDRAADKRWVDPLNYGLGKNRWDSNENGKRSVMGPLVVCLKQHCRRVTGPMFQSCVRQNCHDFVPWTKKLTQAVTCPDCEGASCSLCETTPSKTAKHPIIWL